MAHNYLNLSYCVSKDHSILGSHCSKCVHTHSAMGHAQEDQEVDLRLLFRPGILSRVDREDKSSLPLSFHTESKPTVTGSS